MKKLFTRIWIQHATYREKTILFNRRVIITLRKDKAGYFVLKNKELNLLCFGKTLKEAFLSLMEDIFFLYKTITQSDKPMTKKALELKKLLNSLMLVGFEHIDIEFYRSCNEKKTKS